MLRGLRTAAVALSLIGSAGLYGCAENSYPTLPSLSGIGSPLLTKEQQQKTINEMKSEQENHGAEAVKEIEGRK